MIEKFREILSKIESEYGSSVALFALLKMDDLTDRWTVMYSAAWFKEGDGQKIFDNIIDYMRQVLDADELASIARVGLFKPDYYLIRILLKYQTGTEIRDEKINGNFVHEGYILKSNPEAVSSSTTSSLFSVRSED